MGEPNICIWTVTGKRITGGIAVMFWPKFALGWRTMFVTKTKIIIWCANVKSLYTLFGISTKGITWWNYVYRPKGRLTKQKLHGKFHPHGKKYFKRFGEEGNIMTLCLSCHNHSQVKTISNCIKDLRLSAVPISCRNILIPLHPTSKSDFCLLCQFQL